MIPIFSSDFCLKILAFRCQRRQNLADVAGEAHMQGKPLAMLLMMLAGWINRHQQEAIEYLKEENTSNYCRHFEY
jgi:hypothetical protein